MNVSESKFRQILREEARRVLREQATPTAPPPAGGTGATPPNAKEASWSAVDTELNTLTQQTASFAEAQNIIKSAKEAWKQCLNTTSPKSLAVVDAIDANASQSLGVQLARALLNLTNTREDPAGGAMQNFMPFGNYAPKIEAVSKILEHAGKTLVPMMKKHFATIEPTAAPTTPTKVGAPYTVLKGESISLIAQKKYTPSVPLSKASMDMYKKIASDNGVDQNTFVIQPGQSLQLPQTLKGPTGTLHALR